MKLPEFLLIFKGLSSKTVYFPAYSRQEYSMFMNGWGTLTGEASYTLGGLAHSNNPDLKLGAYNRLEYKNDENNIKEQLRLK